MSHADIERFVADLRSDPELQAAVRQHRDAEELWALAQARGYAFSRSEMASCIRGAGPDDPAALSGEDLKLVAGGTGSISDAYWTGWGGYIGNTQWQPPGSPGSVDDES
jgi:predicted ribosomally synthesized peptide with nif11-like leader